MDINWANISSWIFYLAMFYVLFGGVFRQFKIRWLDDLDVLPKTQNGWVLLVLVAAIIVVFCVNVF